MDRLMRFPTAVRHDAGIAAGFEARDRLGGVTRHGFGGHPTACADRRRRAA